jgi:drug/metabolite transporter (DMT)-like permease
MIFWSLSFIWYKGAYQHFGPITTIFLRLFVSSILLLIFTFVVLKPIIKKSHIKLFVLVAMFEPFLYFLCESFGMKWVSPVTASVIVATIPLFIPLASRFIFREKIKSSTIGGIIVSFIGVCMVILSKEMKIDGSLKGTVLMFGAVISAVFYSLTLRKLTPLYDAITIIAVQNSIGTLLFLPLLLIFEPPGPQLFNLPTTAYLPIIYLAIFASSLAFIMYAFGVGKIGVSRTSVFTNLIPVITSIFSFLMLKETFSPLKIAGIIVVIVGLVISQLENSRKG